MKKVLLTRISIVILFFLSTVILFVRQTEILFIFSLTIMSVGLYLDRRHKLEDRIRPLFLVSALIILFQVIFNNALSIPSRLNQGLIASFKIFSLSMLVFILTTITSIKQIIDALSFIPRNIRLMIIITFSMIPAIFEESRKIMTVQNARGHNTKSINVIKSFIPFIIPLLHRTLKRAEHLSLSLESRGYRNG